MAKIDFSYLLIFKNFVRLALGNDFTIAQNISTMAYSEGFADIMVGYQDADIETGQMFNAFLDIDHGDGINTGKRLVQQDESGFRGQCARYFHAPALTAGQAHAGALADVFDLEFFQQHL